jgi:hypothetical protein
LYRPFEFFQLFEVLPSASVRSFDAKFIAWLQFIKKKWRFNQYF